MAVPPSARETEPLSYLQALRAFNPNARLYLLHVFFSGINFGLFSLAFNLYLNSLGYTNDFVGTVNAIPAIVILLLGLPIGFLADRIGYRPFLLVGALLIAGASLLPFVSSVAAVIILFVLCVGIGRQFTWVLGQPLLAALSTPRERLYLFSINSSVLTISIALGSLLGGAIPEAAARYLNVSANSSEALRTTFAAMTISALISFVPLLRMRVPPVKRPTLDGRSSAPGNRPAARKIDVPVFTKLLLPEAIVGLGAGALVVFFQLYYRQRFNLGPGTTGIILAFSSVVTAGTQLCGPFLAQRIGKVRTLVVLQLCSVPFLLILAFTHSLPLAILAFYLRDALMNSGWPIAQSFAMEHVTDEQRAPLASLEAMLGSAGRGGLGPLISGYLQRLGSYELAFSFTATTYLIAALLYYAFWRNAEREQHAGRVVPNMRRS